MTQETTQGVTANYSYFRDNLPDLFTKGTSSSKYIYSNANSRIIKFNTITNIKEYYIEDMAVYNSGSTDLFWYVPGSGNEVKFKHHSVITSWELNSNTGATSYTTDPFNIPLTQTSVNAYPDMDYIMNDHLGSTRMIYKLNHTCAGVYQNATIQYMADYYAFGKKVREYINPGTVTEKYQYTGKERDIESGYDYFMARNYHSEIGRFMSVDPLAGKYPSWSPYNYTMNNPIMFIDPDGMEPNSIEGPGDPPKPSVAGLLYEAYLNADAAVFNFLAKGAEVLGYGKPGINIRKEVQYDDYGGVRK